MVNIIKYFKVILGWRNWAVFTYNSFIENIFIVFFIALAKPDFSNNFLWNIFLFYFFSIFSTSYGYLVNDLADVELDRSHCKLNIFIGVKRSQVIFYVLSAFLFSAIFAIPFLENGYFIVLWILWIFLTTFYSLKPFRFKEKGKSGLVVVVFAQRLLPTLLIFAAFTYFQWLDIIIISMYVLFRGLSSDVNHQLEDYQFDSKTETATFAVGQGYEKTQKIFIYILRIERILFFGFLIRMLLLFNQTHLFYFIISWILLIGYTIMILIVENMTQKGIIINPFSKGEKNIVQFIHHPFPTIIVPLFLSFLILFTNIFYFILIFIFILNKIICDKFILTNNFLFLMMNKNVFKQTKILIILIESLLIIIYVTQLQAQLNLKRDDFVNTTNRRWWRWYDDGPSTPYPSVKNGYVLFSLVNPISSWDPYCDAALWDGYPWPGGPYGSCEITLRAKALNLHRYGSRGWGLWYTEATPILQRQIWFMEMLDDPLLTGEDWWRAETANGRTEATHHYTELDEEPHIVDNMEWHTYKIIRQPDYIDMLVDDESVLYSTEDLPTENLGFHIWVDNLIYQHVEPDIINIYKRGWIGRNEIVLDYVQILTTGSLQSSETPAGIKLLREKPNEIGNGQYHYLWKDYTFNSPGGKTAILVTGRVERYLDDGNQPISDDDDMRFIIDGIDYGWDNQFSFNADAQGTTSKTILLEQVLTSGDNKTVQIYGDITPLLTDITILGSQKGGIIFNQEYNETGTGGTDYLWKEIQFLCHNGEIGIYVSGSADEDPTPYPSSHYGYSYNDYSDLEDDDLRIVLDGNDYGYHTNQSLWGNRQFGEPKSILITANLSQGSHILRLFANNTPTLFRVLIYGENDDIPLPVTLSSFVINAKTNSNLLTWQTESEINNLGFNIYRAESEIIKPESELIFSLLTHHLIEGSGNSNQPRHYFYTDFSVKDNCYYWYQLEDIDFNGNKKRHPSKMIYRSENIVDKFELFQNYPNPFNNSTQIKYTLPSETSVNWKIYSIDGKLICSQNFSNQAKGIHVINWDGTNQTGTQIPPGIYYFCLSTNEESKTIPIVLLK